MALKNIIRSIVASLVIGVGSGCRKEISKLEKVGYGGYNNEREDVPIVVFYDVNGVRYALRDFSSFDETKFSNKEWKREGRRIQGIYDVVVVNRRNAISVNESDLSEKEKRFLEEKIKGAMPEEYLIPY